MSISPSDEVTTFKTHSACAYEFVAACRAGDAPAAVACLISCQPPPNTEITICTRQSDCSTTSAVSSPLQCAVNYGNAELVGAVVRAGVDVDKFVKQAPRISNREGLSMLTAIGTAIVKQSPEMLGVLHEAGADFYRVERVFAIRATQVGRPWSWNIQRCSLPYGTRVLVNWHVLNI